MNRTCLQCVRKRVIVEKGAEVLAGGGEARRVWSVYTRRAEFSRGVYAGWGRCVQRAVCGLRPSPAHTCAHSLHSPGARTAYGMLDGTIVARFPPVPYTSPGKNFLRLTISWFFFPVLGSVSLDIAKEREEKGGWRLRRFRNTVRCSWFLFKLLALDYALVSTIYSQGREIHRILQFAIFLTKGRTYCKEINEKETVHLMKYF